MGPPRSAIADVMTNAPRTIAPDALAGEALHAMNAHERPITSSVVDAAAGHSASSISNTRCARGRMSIVPLPARPHHQSSQRLLNSAAGRFRQPPDPMACPPADCDQCRQVAAPGSGAAAAGHDRALAGDRPPARTVRVAYERMGGREAAPHSPMPTIAALTSKPPPPTAATAEQIGPNA
jgi:hypothetical protein